MHAVYCDTCIYKFMLSICTMSCVYGNAIHAVVQCVHEVILFFLQTMKIVLVVVACFAAVNCQDAACLANRVLNNPSLATCISANNVSLIYIQATNLPSLK